MNATSRATGERPLVSGRAREVSKRGLSVTPSGIESKRRAGMRKLLEDLDAIGMLKLWGLRVIGSAFTDPNDPGAHASMSNDVALALCNYVEGTDGFANARPLLKHVYIEFLPIASYRYRMPGETRWQAAYRHKQLTEYGNGWPDDVLSAKLHGSFVEALNERMSREPFVEPKQVEEMDLDAIVEAASAAAERKYPLGAFGPWSQRNRQERTG